MTTSRRLLASVAATAAFATAVALTTVACGDDDEAGGQVHWGYDGDVAPERWGGLSPDFAACEDGKEQSPIELGPAVPRGLPDIAFDYKPAPLTIQDNGHTVQVTYEAGSSVAVGGRSYALVQFHFHAHSEHTLNGRAFPLELHLVHRAADGALAVVGVLVERGAHNAAYDAVLSRLPEEESEEAETVAGATVDAAALLPPDRRYYAYDGSLTTPPCSEGVAWHVLAEPVQVSDAQIAAFTALHDDNFRPPQPLEGRELALDND